MALGSNRFTFNASNTTGVNLDYAFDAVTTHAECAMLGHQVDRWVEYLDGLCAGYCIKCSQRVTTRREPGGIPFLRLKALVERLLAAPNDISLVLEMSEIEALLEAEARTIEDARSLVVTARKMIECKKD